MDINIKPLYKLQSELRHIVKIRSEVENEADRRRSFSRNAIPTPKPDIEEQIFRRRTKELDKAVKMLVDVEQILKKHNKL